MDRVLYIGLVNALFATVLAGAVWVVTRFVRKPAVARALWLLVLLKLLTPPLWTVRVPWPNDTHPPEHPVMRTMPAAPPSLVADDPMPAVVREPDDREATVLPTAPPPAAIPVAHLHGSPTWQQVVAVLWAIGSLTCVSIIVIRVRRFAGLLRYAIPAPPEVAEQVAALADRIGIFRRIHVLFVPGRVCPMLWAVGRPKLLVPAELWGRLDDRQRDALLAHELAHFRRRDHLTRAIELAVAVLYWWLPAAWFARRQLREAEEQCCDAWVLWALPRAARQYATALLEAVDFVSSSRAGVPALASGMGEFHHLKRRLVMIKQGNVSRAMSWSSLLSVCGLAGVLLPLAPGRAQDAKPEEKTTAVQHDAVPLNDVAVEGDVVVTLDPNVVPDGNKGSDVKDLALGIESNQVRDAREEVDRLSRQLDKAKQRLAKMEGKSAGRRELRVTRRGREMTLSEPRPENVDPQKRLSDLEQKLNQLADEIRQLCGSLGGGTRMEAK